MSPRQSDAQLFPQKPPFILYFLSQFQPAVLFFIARLRIAHFHHVHSGWREKGMNRYSFLSTLFFSFAYWCVLFTIFRCSLASLWEGLSLRMSVCPSVNIKEKTSKSPKIVRKWFTEHLRYIHSNEIKYLEGASLSYWTFHYTFPCIFVLLLL